MATEDTASTPDAASHEAFAGAPGSASSVADAETAFDWQQILGPYPDFSDQSVEGRNARQNSRWCHPYTCGNDRSDAAHLAYQVEHGGDNGQLLAVEGGWLCPVCGYTQPLTPSETLTDAS